MKDRCNRSGCGKKATEYIEFGQAGYNLCKRCADTIYRRFQKFMAGG